MRLLHAVQAMIKDPAVCQYFWMEVDDTRTAMKLAGMIGAIVEAPATIEFQDDGKILCIRAGLEEVVVELHREIKAWEVRDEVGSVGKAMGIYRDVKPENCKDCGVEVLDGLRDGRCAECIKKAYVQPDDLPLKPCGCPGSHACPECLDLVQPEPLVVQVGSYDELGRPTQPGKVLKIKSENPDD